VLFLVLLTLPILIGYYIKRIGKKELWYLVIFLAVGTYLLYSAASLVYSVKQEHLFDPFLQIDNPLFEESKEKNDNTYRIVCLGGSTSLGYTVILKEILQEKYPNINIEVLNSARTWYTTKHSLINYATYCRYWNPDAVIVMHGINDLIRSFSPTRLAIGQYNNRWTHYYGPSINGANPPFFGRELLRRLARMWYANLRIKPSDYAIEEYKSIDMFGKHLATIVKYTTADNAEVFLVGQPSIFKQDMSKEELDMLWVVKGFCYTYNNYLSIKHPSPESFARAMKKAIGIVKETALSSKGFFIDADHRIPKNLKHFIDDCHYTASGHRLLANIIADRIVESRVIEKKISNLDESKMANIEQFH